MSLVYVALGSNLGTPESQLTDALARIEQLPETSDLEVSNWYVTEAIGGPENQPDYLNAVCRFETLLSPLTLLTALQNIEHAMGRVRDVRWGPRTLDLDIIWWEGFTRDTPELTVPHPRAHERAFVLKPLLDLDARFQLQGTDLAELLKGLADQKIRLR